MPIYEYAAVTKGCAFCTNHFEQMEKVTSSPLTHCPQCAAEVKRIISSPSVISGQAHLQKESHLEKHGFTQYRRAGKGIYEKTAGKGPQFISDD